MAIGVPENDTLLIGLLDATDVINVGRSFVHDQEIFLPEARVAIPDMIQSQVRDSGHVEHHSVVFLALVLPYSDAKLVISWDSIQLAGLHAVNAAYPAPQLLVHAKLG